MSRREYQVLSVLLGVTALSFVLLTADVWHTNGEVALDRGVSRLGMAAAEEPLLDAQRRRAEMGEKLGSRRGVGLAATVFFGLALVWRQWVAGIVCFVSPVACFFVIEYVAKPLINEPIPFGGRAYPSGHAAGVAAVVVSATILLYRRCGGLGAILFAPVALGAVLAVGFGVLGLRFHHYPTDVVGGVTLGGAVVLGLTLLLRSASRRFVDAGSPLTWWPARLRFRFSRTRGP